jgi:hypothetical protein
LWRNTVLREIWAVPVTGNGADQINVTWPAPRPATTGDGFANGVATIEVFQVSGTNPLTVGDFTQVMNVDATTVTQTIDPPVVSPEFDAGACDAVYFGTGRHVAHNPGAPTNDLPGDDNASWSDPSSGAVVEVSERNTWNSTSSCQIGTTAGLIPGGSGPMTLAHRMNNNGTPPAPPSTRAQWTGFAPSACTADPGTNTPVTTTGCSVTATNPACNPDCIPKVTIEGGIDVTITPGGRYTVCPRLNGTLLTAKQFDISNPDAVNTLTMGLPFSYLTYQTGTTIGPGVTTPAQTLEWVLTRITGGPNSDDDQIIIREHEVTVELVHI